VDNAVRMLDGDGVMVMYPVSGGLYDQPARDMEIYDVVRSRWNELRHADFERMQREQMRRR
jgi:hypothetical protein